MRRLLTLGLLTVACQKPRSEPPPAPAVSASAPAPAVPATDSATAARGGKWTEAGRLSMARGGFTLVARADGAVLAVGGVENGGESRPSAYVDVYRDGAWTRGPELPTPRKSASVVALKDGGVLVAFGFAQKGVVAGGERLDPTWSKWTAVPTPLTGAPQLGSDIGATLLDDGRVLVAGGHDKNSDCMADAALFDPTKNTWAPAPKLPEPQVFGALHASGGLAYLVGGLCDNDYFPLRVFDPAKNAWSMGTPGPVERIGDRVTRLSDGRLLVTGGEPSERAKDPEAVRRVALFDPKTNTWRAGPSLAGPRKSHGVAQLPDGRVMLAGGEDRSFHEIDTVELYDPWTNTVTGAAPLPRAVMRPELATLPDGRVLLVGGWINTPGRYVGEAWLYSP